MSLLDFIPELGLVVLGTSIAFTTTVVLIPHLRRIAFRYRWLDRPDVHRKHHVLPTPVLGGVGIVGGILAGVLFLWVVHRGLDVAVSWPPLMVWLGAATLALAGFWDDTRGLGFKPKLLVEAIVAYALLHAGFRIDVSALPFVEAAGYDQALYSIPLTMLWIVGVINAVNLIDGIDGLAAGVAVIAFFCMSVIFGINGDPGLSVIAFVVSGALLGFLAFNFNPASIFMGDTGSLLVGYLLAIFSLSGRSHPDPVLTLFVPVVVLGLPVLDTLFSITRRLRAGHAICAPDNDHIHHRMARLLPIPKAVLALYVVALGFGLAAVAMAVLHPVPAFAILAAVAIVSAGGLTMLSRRTAVSQTPRSSLPAPASSKAVAPRKRHLHRVSYRDQADYGYDEELTPVHHVEEQLLKEVA